MDAKNIKKQKVEQKNCDEIFDLHCKVFMSYNLIIAKGL